MWVIEDTGSREQASNSDLSWENHSVVHIRAPRVVSGYYLDETHVGRNQDEETPWREIMYTVLAISHSALPAGLLEEKYVNLNTEDEV